MVPITFASTRTTVRHCISARGRSHCYRLLIVAGVVVAAMFASPASATAATFWWNNATTGLWTNGALWSNAASGGSSGTAPTNDTTTDVVVFNTTGTNGAVVSQLSQSQSIGGITANNTGATTIRSDSGSARLLTLGAAGITINAGAGAFTIGASGSMVNVAIAGSQSWTNNSSNTFTASGSITSSVAGLQTLSIAGSGNTTLSGILGNGSGTLALTKSGAGTLTMSAANTYSGTTNILGGSFTLNGAAGALQSTAAVNVSGNATLNLGDSTAGNGRADRINTAASLTLGGTAGAGSLAVVRGSTTANSQTLASLVVGAGGLSTISSSGTTGGAPTVTFNGANPYLRPTAGGVVNVNTTNVAMAFGATAPSGSGNVAGTGADAILVGAMLNSSDLIASGSGALAAAVYYTTTDGGTTAANYAGKNVNVTSATTLGGTISPNSIRFADSSARTITLTGVNSIGSGMILQTSSGSAGTITGGTIASGNGLDLIVVNNLAANRRRSDATVLSISSVITGSAALTLAGNGSTDQTVLSGVNTFSGNVTLNAAGVRVAADTAFGNSANGIWVNGTSGIFNSAAMTLNRPVTLGNGASLILTNASNGAITLSGSITGGDSASSLLIGWTHGVGNGGHSVRITGTNTMLGTIRIYNQLRAYEGAGLSPNAAIVIGDATGGSAVAPNTSGILETSGTIVRSVGTAAGQFSWSSEPSYTSGGFSAVGAPLVIALGGTSSPTPLTWANTAGFLVNNAELRLQNNNATDTVTFQNAIALNGGTRTVFVGASSFAATLSGVISGNASSSLSKTGVGTLVLSGSNSYGGKTIISNGAVSVSTINDSGTNGNLGTNATVDLGSASTAATLIYTGAGETTDRVINLAGTTGGGTIDQSGSGNLRFTASFTTTGAGPKALSLQGSSAGSGELAGTFTDGVTGTTTLTSQFVTGATTITLDSVTGIVTGAAISGANIPASTTVTAVNTSTRVITLSQATTTGTTASGSLITVAGVTNANALTKAGTGTWTLSGTNSYTGVTTVSGGVLAVSNVANGGSNSAVGASSNAAGNLVINGGTLRYTGGAASTDRNFTIGTNGGAIDASGSGALTVSGAPTMSGTNTARTFTLTGASTAANTLGGAIGDNGTGATTLTKSGAGTWVLTGSSSYTGTTSVTNGMLQIGNGGVNGSINSTAGIVVASGATLAFNRSDAYDGVAFAKVISGSGNVLLSTGTLTLSGNNSYSGNTTVSSGQLTLGAASALGTGAVTVNGGVLNISTYAPSVAGFTITGGSLAGSGKLTAPTYGLGGGTVVANLAGGTLNVMANSALNGTADATTVNLNAGTLTLGTGSRFTSASVAVTGSSGASLALGGNETFGSLAGAANIDLGANTLSVGSANISTTFSGKISGSGGLTKLGAGALDLSGSSSYAGATVISAGRLTVASAGSLNGTSGITLNGGDFKYNSATTLTPLITFAGAGGTLSGTGTIGSALTVGTNAILSPGNSPGTQAFASGLAWNPGGTYVWELNSLSGTAGTNWDLLNVSGGTFDISALSAASKFNLNLVTLTGSNTAGPLDSGYVAGSTYEFLITSFATLGSGTNTFGANSDLTSLFNISLAGWQGTQPSLSDISVKVNNAGTGIQLVIVPEPGTIVFAGIGIAMTGWSLWKRRRDSRLKP